MNPNLEQRAGQGMHDASGSTSAGQGGRWRDSSRGWDVMIVVFGVLMFFMGSCVGACSRWDSGTLFPHGLVSP